MRIYMDVCCINRPFDDLSIGRNRLEAEAVMEIVRHIQSGEWELLSSQAIDTELSAMPSTDRRAKIMAILQLQSSSVDADENQRARAMQLLPLGIRYMDAMHLACAESGRCDVFLTTDDALLAKSRAYEDRIMVRVANPLQWIAEVSAP